MIVASVGMAVMRVVECEDSHHVHQQTKGADDKQLPKPLDFTARVQPLHRFIDDFDADYPVLHVRKAVARDLTK